MKNKHPLFYHISIFILAQIAWLMLLGIWIYWYVSNYIIFEEVGDKVSPQVLYDNINVIAFVGGLILLVGISFGMSMTFRHLNVQIRLNKLYDNFIGNITHELKSPLSSIQLYLETLDGRKVPPEKQKEFIELMKKDADRLNRLINSILEISTIEQKKIAHDYQVFKSGELIKKMVLNSAEQFKVPADSVTFNGEPLCEIVADRNALKIVFDNLVDNAVKYSHEPVKINVSMKCDSKIFTVEFSDKGIGILPGDQKKIFNKFHRVYSADIPNVKGTGLGLYWVREIIKFHKGTISVSSAGKDKGTKFKIELPVYKAVKKRYFKKMLAAAKQKNIKNEETNE